MIVTVDRLARPVDVATFTDITGKECISVAWDEAGKLVVQFAVNLTVDEIRQVRVRCLTADAAAETLLRGVVTAYQTNADYLALPVPTTVQTVGQIAALTRQLQAVIRLLAPVEV